MNDWQQQNWRVLFDLLAEIRQALDPDSKEGQTFPIPDSSGSTSDFALDRLCTAFELSHFERKLLLLCAGMELQANTFAALCATAQGNPQKCYPTFQLAMTLFAEIAYWSALIPDRPLRRWRLIEVELGQVLMLSPLRIDERILHYLTGNAALDERIGNLIQPMKIAADLVPSHQQLAEQLAKLLASRSEAIVQLCGADPTSKQAIAIAACSLENLPLYSLSAQSLPTTPKDLQILILLWQREVRLAPAVLLLDCEGTDENEGLQGAIARWITGLNTPLIVTRRERRSRDPVPMLTFEVHPPTTDEQRHLWKIALGQSAPEDRHINALVEQFSLNVPTIQTVCTEFNTQTQQNDRATVFDSLWDACRAQSRPRLDDLAQGIKAFSSWDDLVLPERESQVLRSIAAHVRQRNQVYERWGFAAKGQRGLGIAALFAGVSGTGKTMSAEVLAQELRLDLYRIDLSSVVSKYIGETEKNLRRVFDAAEAGATILLFDEADALFGKRSEVKDSHDRYANMEVSYLLQRMESYRGLAILTTNMKEAIDPAFLRRIRFIVKFPFPDVEQRSEIWRRIFPSDTPTIDLDVNKLARLNVAGGNIRNIALNAAFLAADARESVGMKHLLEASRSEYAKLERSLTDAEVKGWV